MKILVALALSLFVVTTASAGHRQTAYEDLVRWAGCDARVVTNDQYEIVQSVYDPNTHTIYLGGRDGLGLSREASEVIVLHEVGHCLQDQAGLFGVWTDVALELDADRTAANLSCALGRDGRQIMHDLFVWFHKSFGYDGDPAHGTLVQRISQGDSAALCRAQEPQA